MQVSLASHPDFRCQAVTRIGVDVSRSGGMLALVYAVEGSMADVRFPAAAASVRADELWKHTCLEAFVRAKGRAAYCELNLAPSTQWAAYRFDDYRAGMRNAECPVPQTVADLNDARLMLRASLSLGALDGFAGVPWELGLTAVIEEKSGLKSYWSLKHPPGRPDFHHSDGFALEIPAA
jgi:hypothetical protein